MRLTAAAAVTSLLAACGAEAGQTQPPPSRVSVTNLSDTPIPSFAGQLVIGNGLDVFGMILRGDVEDKPGFILVEMLTSQTASQMRLRATKIDALSFVYQLDCSTMRYRLANQVNYERTGQPMFRVNLDNALIDGPMADYLNPACGRAPREGIQLGTAFTSIDTFLTAADTVLTPRITTLPRSSVTVTTAEPQD